jgi:hypothetical protein
VSASALSRTGAISFRKLARASLKEQFMLNKSGMLLAGAIVAVGGSVASADPGDYNHRPNNSL